MTRLTDALVEREWDAASHRVVEFAHRIAALAVQDMTRYADALKDEVAGFEAMWKEREKAHDAALAEVTKERDAARAERADLDSRNTALRAQLATAKREERIEGFKDGWHDAIERAMDMGLVDLGSFPITGRRKRERTKGEEWAIAGLGANEAASKRYPATPSGEGCVRCGDTCKPWCHNATPSPEAREVPSEVVVRVETRRGIGWYSNGETIVRITPADAKRIVAMGTA
jgi:hypothetical protein